MESFEPGDTMLALDALRGTLDRKRWRVVLTRTTIIVKRTDGSEDAAHTFAFGIRPRDENAAGQHAKRRQNTDTPLGRSPGRAARFIADSVDPHTLHPCSPFDPDVLGRLRERVIREGIGQRPATEA